MTPTQTPITRMGVTVGWWMFTSPELAQAHLLFVNRHMTEEEPAVAQFFGKRYRYPTPADGTVTIGVCRGLDDNAWIVGYSRGKGFRASIRRIKSGNLPPLSDAGRLQSLLDAWAQKRRLPEVA